MLIKTIKPASASLLKLKSKIESPKTEMVINLSYLCRGWQAYFCRQTGSSNSRKYGFLFFPSLSAKLCKTFA